MDGAAKKAEREAAFFAAQRDAKAAELQRQRELDVTSLAAMDDTQRAALIADRARSEEHEKAKARVLKKQLAGSAYAKPGAKARLLGGGGGGRGGKGGRRASKKGEVEPPKAIEMKPVMMASQSLKAKKAGASMAESTPDAEAAQSQHRAATGTGAVMKKKHARTNTGTPVGSSASHTPTMPSCTRTPVSVTFTGEEQTG